jgi:hypothetical protein
MFELSILLCLVATKLININLTTVNIDTASITTNVFIENQCKFRLQRTSLGGTLSVNIYTINHGNYGMYNPLQCKVIEKLNILSTKVGIKDNMGIR